MTHFLIACSNNIFYLNLRNISGGGMSAPGVSAPGGCLLRGGLLWGGVCSRGVSALGGCLLPGGGSAQGGLLWAGVCSGGCLLRGVCIPACTEADTPTPCGQTDACKNITFATSLRTVYIRNGRFLVRSSSRIGVNAICLSSSEKWT